MFEGRFLELLIIFVLALVVLGPEKLPRVVAEVGRWVGRARAMARQFREQLEEEVHLEEQRKAQASRAQQPAPPPPESSGPASAPPMDVGEALNPIHHHDTHEASTPPPAPPEVHTAPLHSTSAADLEGLPPEHSWGPAIPHPPAEAPAPRSEQERVSQTASAQPVTSESQPEPTSATPP
jgi:sec-independent protein translocase protein TatB